MIRSTLAIGAQKMMMRRSVLTALMAVALILTVVACSGSGTTPTTAAEGGSPSGPGSPVGGSDASGQASQTSVRIGNFYTDKDLKPGPAVDVYDVHQGQAATPILTAVAYGSFSAYVHPHVSGSVVVVSGRDVSVVNLYVLPTGEDPVANQADAKGIGSYGDDGSHFQETLILESEGSSGSADLETGPIDGLAVSSVFENGDDANGGQGPVASPPAAGQAELLVSTSVVDFAGLRSTTGTNVEYYFFVDTSCDPPLNGAASQEPGLPFVFAISGPPLAIFVATPGSHQLSVVAGGEGTLPTCGALTPKQGQISVDLTAGEQSLVYIYGTSATDLHLAVGPIQP